MKKLFIFSMLILIFGQLSAQDLIVTKNGDSIQCKIATIKHNNIYYHTEVETLPKALSISDVEKYKHNYFRPKNTDYQKWVFSINGGYSRRLAKVADNEYADQNEKLKTGYHLGADIAYYFSEGFGIGAKCVVFKTSHSQDVYLIANSYDAYHHIYDYQNPFAYVRTTEYTYKYVRVEDKHTIPFIGPMISTRFYGEKRQSIFLMNYSIGYLWYKDKRMEDNSSFTFTGNTLGLLIDLGYDYWFSKNNALGVRLSLIGGSLKKYTYDNGKTKEKVNLDKNKYEGLGRLDVSVGLRFGK